MRKFLFSLVVSICTFGVPALVFAHGFGTQYTLPLPASLYILGGTSALIASFAILSLYSAPIKATNVLRARRIFFIPQLQKVVRLLSNGGLLFFFLTIATGALGSQFLYENPAPILFWSILLLWFAYANALLGNLWELINPFKKITQWTLERHSPLFSYPTWLGYLPALLLYYIILWIELFSGGLGGSALFLSIILQIYLIITLFGSFLFGVEKWFTYGDFFSVFFGIIGKFAPVFVKKDQLEITLPTERLITNEEKEPTIILFILFFLASTAFDGLRETSVWVTTILALPESVGNYFSLLSQLTLFATPFIFSAIYFLVIWLMKTLTQEPYRVMTLALRFISSFIPIGIAYSLAHYTGPLFIDAQYLIPLASDPFGFGWNLFGTRDYIINIAIISVQTVWYIQLSAIIFGHIVAACVGHGIARRTFATKRSVILSQLPMMILMVFYTIFGLWILSEPYATGSW